VTAPSKNNLLILEVKHPHTITHIAQITLFVSIGFSYFTTLLISFTPASTSRNQHKKGASHSHAPLRPAKARQKHASAMPQRGALIPCVFWQ
jgi:hypothetical protein